MHFVLTLNQHEISKLEAVYMPYKVQTNETYIKARFQKPGLNITVYTSGKVLFQGKKAESAYVIWSKNTSVQANMNDYYLESIGSDESGVGDYFGPLTVCAAYLGKENLKKISALNIKDSKKLSDKEIHAVAKQLMSFIPHSLLVLDNPKYNTLIDQGYNAHKLKAYLHAQAHQHLIKKIGKKPLIIVDQFAHEEMYLKYLEDYEQPLTPDIFRTKAETYYASVAIASIIARYAFITKLDKLSKEFNMQFKKGASSEVDKQAKQIKTSHGMNVLRQVAKLHFKTTKKLVE